MKSAVRWGCSKTRKVTNEPERIIVLDAKDQQAFWRALNEPVELTLAQRRLGAVMRGRR